MINIMILVKIKIIKHIVIGKKDQKFIQMELCNQQKYILLKMLI